MPAERVAMGHAREPVRFPAADLDNSSLRSHMFIKRCVNIASSFSRTPCVHTRAALQEIDYNVSSLRERPSTQIQRHVRGARHGRGRTAGKIRAEAHHRAKD